MDHKIDVAVLGATGAVGQRFIQLLEGHPWFRVTELVASDRSAGQRYREAARWILAGGPPDDLRGSRGAAVGCRFAGADRIFGAACRHRQNRRMAAGGKRAYRLHERQRLPDARQRADPAAGDQRRTRAAGRSAAREIRLERRRPGHELQLYQRARRHAVSPLRRFNVEAVQVVSMQAISGGGYPGVASLDIFDNVIPFINGEESKVEAEPRKMLGTLAGDHIELLSYAASATCTRVPVLDGHTVSVSVRFADPVSEADLIAAWENFVGPEPVPGLPSAPDKPIVYRREPDRPQPRKDRDAGHGMATSIGRLRPDPVIGGWKFIGLSHNTVRGAAGCSILNAELLIECGYV